MSRVRSLRTRIEYQLINGIAVARDSRRAFVRDSIRPAALGLSARTNVGAVSPGLRSATLPSCDSSRSQARRRILLDTAIDAERFPHEKVWSRRPSARF